MYCSLKSVYFPVELLLLVDFPRPLISSILVSDSGSCEHGDELVPLAFHHVMLFASTANVMKGEGEGGVQE